MLFLSICFVALMDLQFFFRRSFCQINTEKRVNCMFLQKVYIERVECSMYGWLNWKLSRNINSHESRQLPTKWAASFTVLLSCYTIPKWSRKCAFSKFKKTRFLASFELGNNNKNNYRLRQHELRCTDVILHTDRARESFK